MSLVLTLLRAALISLTRSLVLLSLRRIVEVSKDLRGRSLLTRWARAVTCLLQFRSRVRNRR